MQSQTYQVFKQGDKFRNTFNGKTGTVNRLRNDEYERNARRKYPNQYYYSVSYDDEIDKVIEGKENEKRKEKFNT